MTSAVDQRKIKLRRVVRRGRRKRGCTRKWQQ